jgi:hypothetical protein
MGSLRSIADVTARRLRIVLARQPTYAGACGLEHIRAHSSDRFGDFAGGPVEIGGRLFRIDEMLALNGSSTPFSNKNRLFKNIRAEEMVRPKLVFKLFINCFLINSGNLATSSFNTENNDPYEF